MGKNDLAYLVGNFARDMIKLILFFKNYFSRSYDVIMTSFFAIFVIFSLGFNKSNVININRQLDIINISYLIKNMLRIPKIPSVLSLNLFLTQ